MIFDLASEELHPEPGSFDVCIVGAGAAGITIAADLVGRGRRVLLLEAGGRGHELFSHSIYRSEVVGLPHTGIHEGRFRVIGGTTTEWGGQILELDDIDFQERSWIKGSGWPFGKAVLAPYYARALAFTGLDDAHEDREVWAALGIKPPYYGREFEPVFSRFMGERNFARRNDELLKHHPALTTVLHANLCGVSMAENGDAVRSVRCRAPNGKEAAFEAPFFIFALGGIESSRFFLQPAHEGSLPWEANPWIGRHFADHIVCTGGEIQECRLQPSASYFDYQTIDGIKYHPKIKLSAAAQERQRILNVCGTVFVVDPNRERAAQAFEVIRMLRQKRPPDREDLWRLAIGLPELVAEKFGQKIRHSAPTKAVVRVHCEQEPLGESRITLSDQRDALGLFRTRLDWRSSALELATIRRYVETLRDAFAESQLGRVVLSSFLYDDEELTQTFQDSFHHMGGTRMSESPTGGVVDQNLRVFGTSNLYICSSSVFPTFGFSNPTHTVLALSFRLAEHLAKLSAAGSTVAQSSTT